MMILTKSQVQTSPEVRKGKPKCEISPEKHASMQVDNVEWPTNLKKSSTIDSLPIFVTA